MWARMCGDLVPIKDTCFCIDPDNPTTIIVTLYGGVQLSYNYDSGKEAREVLDELTAILASRNKIAVEDGIR